MPVEKPLAVASLSLGVGPEIHSTKQGVAVLSALQMKALEELFESSAPAEAPQGAGVISQTYKRIW